MKTRGRPKGRSTDRRSFGPLGDLIRKNRLEQGYGLADVAKACSCSVQFISNIEHGRAPLPWEKISAVSSFLGIAVDELQAANLAVRSDFQSFAKTAKARAGIAASTFTLAARDKELQDILAAYHGASIASRKKFVKSAIKLLTE
ncbi:MAG: helix-turn-helix transcriptional regulator [Cryobacterium sp.]|nr:helix-turn-helix transcriptional regulator [Oligoflexia bacterium]